MRALLDMSTSAQIKDSLKLGAEVLGRMGAIGRPHKAHVEQAGFAVLKAPDVPSILVETRSAAFSLSAIQRASTLLAPDSLSTNTEAPRACGFTKASA